MKIVNESFTFTQESKTAVSLVEYCKYLGYSEYAFFGLTNANNTNGFCDIVLTTRQRNLISSALIRAQTQMEEIVNFYLSPTWTYQEPHAPTTPIHLSKCWVRELGVKSRALVDTYTIDYGGLYDADEFLISPVHIDVITAASFESLSIHYPISQVEIIPSSYESITGGYRIYIPISRLATESMVDGQVYSALDIASYQLSIEVYSTTTIDPIASFTTITSSTPCEETSTDPDCTKIINSKTSIVRVSQNNYKNNREVLINYLSYLTPDDVIKTAIIRLAHTLLEREPCACDKVRYIWEKDRLESDLPNVSECPFGTTVAAMYAWKIAQKYRVIRGVLI